MFLFSFEIVFTVYLTFYKAAGNDADDEAVVIQEYIHQDDDGFESLNGNVSSEIGEVAADQPASKIEEIEKDEENEEPVSPGNFKCRNWYHGVVRQDRRQHQNETHQCRSSGLSHRPRKLSRFQD